MPYVGRGRSPGIPTPLPLPYRGAASPLRVDKPEQVPHPLVWILGRVVPLPPIRALIIASFLFIIDVVVAIVVAKVTAGDPTGSSGRGPRGPNSGPTKWRRGARFLKDKGVVLMLSFNNGIECMQSLLKFLPSRLRAHPGRTLPDVLIGALNHIRVVFQHLIGSRTPPSTR